MLGGNKPYQKLVQKFPNHSSPPMKLFVKFIATMNSSTGCQLVEKFLVSIPEEAFQTNDTKVILRNLLDHLVKVGCEHVAQVLTSPRKKQSKALVPTYRKSVANRPKLMKICMFVMEHALKPAVWKKLRISLVLLYALSKYGRRH